ncbi:MAG: dihydroorotate dehydrogenase electron transfer subunit [Thermoguttaceae bacterium]
MPPSYADFAWHGAVELIEKVNLARDTFRIRFFAPEIAKKIVPGQFVMLRLDKENEPLLGRPLAMYDVVLDANGQGEAIDIVFIVVGKMTRSLSELKPKAKLQIWGPLGNGFPATDTEHLIMVAGGIGQTPFFALAKEYLGLQHFGDPARKVSCAKKVTFCYGARTAEYLACVGNFQRLGVDVRLSTDDGSQGHHGLVTELLKPLVESAEKRCRIVCCGPEPMMRTTAEIAQTLGVPCQLSLETPMACGIGICFSCVAKIRDAQGIWDYRRTCVEGPVFDAVDVELD